MGPRSGRSLSLGSLSDLIVLPFLNLPLVGMDGGVGVGERNQPTKRHIMWHPAAIVTYQSRTADEVIAEGQTI